MLSALEMPQGKIRKANCRRVAGDVDQESHLSRPFLGCMEDKIPVSQLFRAQLDEIEGAEGLKQT